MAQSGLNSFPDLGWGFLILRRGSGGVGWVWLWREGAVEGKVGGGDVGKGGELVIIIDLL